MAETDALPYCKQGAVPSSLVDFAWRTNIGILVLSLLGYHIFDFCNEYGEKWYEQRTYLIKTEIVQGESLKFGVTPDFPRGLSAWVGPVQSLD